MASNTNYLEEVGREGYAVLDRIYRPRLMARGAKNQYILQQFHEVVRDTSAPYHGDVIDSKMAAKKYRGVVIEGIQKSKVLN